MNKQNDHLALCWPWTSEYLRKVFSFILNSIILQLNHTCKIIIILRLWSEHFRSSSFIIQRRGLKRPETKKSGHILSEYDMA